MGAALATLSLAAADAGAAKFPFERAHKYEWRAAGDVLASADFNGDGHQDLLLRSSAAAKAPLSLSVRLGQGGAEFGNARRIVRGVEVKDVAVSNLDRRRGADLAIASGGGVQPVVLTTLLGDRGGRFVEADERTLPFDFPNQGYRPEVEVARSAGNRPALILRAFAGSDDASVGSIATDRRGRMGPLVESPLSMPPAFHPGYGEIPTIGDPMAAGDFNADGSSDLAFEYFPTQNSRSNGLVVLMLGAPDGTFAEDVTAAGTVGADGISVADLNDDGFDDLVTSGSATPQSSVRPYLFMNTGTADFEAPSGLPNCPFRDYPPPAIADFNGDGHLDIVDPHRELRASGQCYWRGRGDGTFANAIESKPLLARSIVAGEFDGDRLPDLAISTSNSLVIERNISR
ncbi:MAG: VCBS repeat-containing protein [Solirubrobacterales bacterium]